MYIQKIVIAVELNLSLIGVHGELTVEKVDGNNKHTAMLELSREQAQAYYDSVNGAAELPKIIT
jgi:hypothetical protein